MNMAKVGYLRRSYTFLSEWLGSPHIQIRGLYINQYRNQCRGLGMRFCWALVSTKNCLKIERIHSKVLGRASNGGDLANIYVCSMCMVLSSTSLEIFGTLQTCNYLELKAPSEGLRC